MMLADVVKVGNTASMQRMFGGRCRLARIGNDC